jgi:serine/threonine protein kinase
MDLFFQFPLVLIGPFLFLVPIMLIFVPSNNAMNDISTSGPIQEQFILSTDLSTAYEPLESRSFNQLMKVKRQGRWFVLKGLKSEYRHQQVYLELLKKEYELMVQLDHPNIVRVSAKEINDELGPCIVMEYIDGVTLDQFLESKPSQQVRRKVVDQLIDALAYIHGKQIVHRDLKPSNILVTHNGNNVKIIDFGLSDADDYAILKQAAGTVSYMAPEQLEHGAKIDCHGDQYAFGLLLGKLFPYRYRHIAAKCTREEAAKRFPDMEAVRKALERQDQIRRSSPLVMTVLLAALCVWLVARRPVASPEVPETIVSVMTVDEKNYLDEASWYMSKLVQPIIQEAKQGKEYREVLLAKMSKTIGEMKELRNTMSLMYSGDNQKKTTFDVYHLQTVENQHKYATGIINEHCRSFKEDFQKHLIDQAAYDSLEWLVSAEVITLPVTEVTATTATGVIGVVGKSYCGGMELGLCWGMLHYPTVKGQHACCDRLGDSIVLSGLHPDATYFARAYLSGSAGIVYGNEISFTTLPSKNDIPLPEGALPGLFSVGEGKQVWFSKGNLQYRATTGTWRFAEHQYDIVGKDNDNISETYDGWIDLFGWCTSGYDHGAVNWQPWSGNKDTQSNALHHAYGEASCNLYDHSGEADWGYNAISNGGNQENQWHTMSRDEWTYLLHVRNTASGVRFANATVNGRRGMVVLPNNWKTSSYQLNCVNDAWSDFKSNLISLSDWQRVLEPSGAVFLPEAGARTIDGVYEDIPTYHTSTAATECAYQMQHGVVGAGAHRGDGFAVRLVREVE